MNQHVSFAYNEFPDLSCTVCASSSPNVETAIIFVHGFRGDRERTWRDFPKLMDEQDGFSAWDAYFLGYRSEREPIGATANTLTDFVCKIFPKPPREIFVKQRGSEEVTIRSEDSSYTKLLLVGHSQGGVVIRKAVLEAIRDDADSSPLSNAEIALFAPALFGMMLSGWYGVVGETRAWRILLPILSGSVSYKELQVGSPFLKSLRKETEALALLAQKSQKRSLAPSARIVWARHDKFVQGGMRYDCDPKYRYLDKDHFGVCKPNGDYREPLRFILNSGEFE